MKITAQFPVSRSLGTRNAPETFRDFRERGPSSGCLTLPGDNVFFVSTPTVMVTLCCLFRSNTEPIVFLIELHQDVCDLSGIT